MNKKIINALLILIGVAAVYCTYQFYYTKNQETIEELKIKEQTIQARINELEALIANEDTYRATIKNVQDDISKKAKEFAKTAEVPDEDVIMYAVNMEKEYVGNANTKSEKEELGNDAFAEVKKLTVEDQKKEREKEEKAKTEKTEEDSDELKSALFFTEIDFVDTASIADFSANFKDCQMSFSLYQTSPTMTFSTNYGGMEYVIDKMVSDQGTKRVLDFIDMKYNRSNGELIGTLGYSIYTMDHENSSKYENLELDEVEDGSENIFGGVIERKKDKDEEENQPGF